MRNVSSLTLAADSKVDLNISRLSQNFAQLIYHVH